jgi:hypothetical protein
VRARARLTQAAALAADERGEHGGVAIPSVSNSYTGSKQPRAGWAACRVGRIHID